MWYRLAAYGTIDLQKISEQEESEQISGMIKFRALPDILDLTFNEVPQELR